MLSRTKVGLFIAIVLLPAVVGTSTGYVQFQHAKQVEFCGSCHVMHDYVEDMRDPDSENLAALHFGNRWIQKDQCYTCHTDYDFLGGPRAKINGMRHAAAYYLSPEIEKIELYQPYKNENCLQCHLGAKKVAEVALHQAMKDDILSGEIACTECHGPVHPGDEDEDEEGEGEAEAEAAAEEDEG